MPTTTKLTHTPPNGCETSSPLASSRQDTSMSGQSSMFGPPTLPNTTSATSLPASVDGHTPSELRDGPTISASGPAPVRVSRFRAVDSGKAMPTNDTSGPLFTHSSPSASLQLFLESRLRARMVVNGSPEYALIWRQQDMPSGPPICALRVSHRRKTGRVFSGWPTPEARAYRDLSSNGIAYAAQRARHQPSPVTAAYVRGYSTAQIPTLLSRLMGYGDQWVRCAPLGTQSSRKSRQSL